MLGGQTRAVDMLLKAGASPEDDNYDGHCTGQAPLPLTTQKVCLHVFNPGVQTTPLAREVA